VDVLVEALGLEGVNRKAILREAEQECKKRQKDGWGASQCREILEKVRGKL
jgi:hypothetical protein